MQKTWLSGWKAICSYVGGVSLKTARKYANKYGMPVHRLPGGTPVAIPQELDVWLVTISEKLKGK